MQLPLFDRHLALYSEEFETSETRPPYPAEARELMVESIQVGGTPSKLTRNVKAHAVANQPARCRRWSTLAQLGDGRRLVNWI